MEGARSHLRGRDKVQPGFGGMRKIMLFDENQSAGPTAEGETETFGVDGNLATTFPCRSSRLNHVFGNWGGGALGGSR